jgi:uncharacterized protein YndB with AHSA1/START domain
MRWLLRIVGVLAVLAALVVITLAVAGERAGAGKSSATVEINRPPAQVFRHITNDQLAKRWVSGLVEMTPTPTGLHARDRLKIAVELNGRRTEMQIIITAIEPNRRLTFTLNSWGASSSNFREKFEYLLTEEDGRTRLRLSGDAEYFGVLDRLMEPFLTASARKKLEANLARLKSQVESEPPLTAPPPDSRTTAPQS